MAEVAQCVGFSGDGVLSREGVILDPNEAVPYDDRRGFFLLLLQMRRNNETIKKRKTGMLANNEGRGRKKIMNSITERRVIHQVKIDPKISAPKIAASTSNTLGRSVSAETPQQFWNEVIFSDESKFNIFGSDGRRMVSRKPNTSHHPKHTIPTVKHGGGSVMQDNDPKHTAFVVEEWLLYHCRNQLNILPQSPDLNVIDHLWSHLERSVQKHQITSKEQLKTVLQEEWLNIAPETTRHLVESMPRRLKLSYQQKFGLAIHQNDHQARRRFVEWAQNEIAVVPDFHKRILFSDEAHFWLNGYVNKQNCRIWSEANPQVYVETPLHPEKLTVWCALWAGGILLQKR
ncbi:transposable element Tc1 transposase [Trichonephila clavipes]|uniref:Transposable element Tc1 transposase n=1 Tax=Trichonephila clavipes TaxID=2585209 RepID=A0A8X6S7G1_TRICX|nr:transposable element Tc1 transposase [Trichonephila clavipes]